MTHDRMMMYSRLILGLATIEIEGYDEEEGNVEELSRANFRTTGHASLLLRDKVILFTLPEHRSKTIFIQ